MTSLKSAGKALFLLVLLTALFPRHALLAQPPVAVFYGTAKVDGALVPDGTIVSAWIQGEKVAEAATSDSKYKLKITQPEGKNFEDKKVSFRIGKDFAAETGVWKAGEVTKLDLNATSTAPKVAFFRGTVRVNNDTVADGTEISAWIEDVKVASTTAVDSGYFLKIPQAQGRYFEGKTISFKIGELAAEQTATWEAGAEVQLNLTATTKTVLLALFSGVVRVDEQPVPDGTPVSAWIEGEKAAETVTANSRYAISIEQPGDKNFQGKAIVFRIGDLEARETATWTAGANVELNLTAKTSALVRAVPLLKRVGRERLFTVEVFIDPRNYGISSAEVEISFDPEVFQAVEVMPGELLGRKPLHGVLDVDNKAGVIKYALARLGRTQPPSPAGTFAFIQFRVRKEAPRGDHTISIVKASLTDEAFRNIPNIKVESAVLRVAAGMLGDINGDGRVNYRDLAILGASYGTVRGDPEFAIEADLNDDGVIDFRDLGILGVNYERS